MIDHTLKCSFLKTIPQRSAEPNNTFISFYQFNYQFLPVKRGIGFYQIDLFLSVKRSISYSIKFWLFYRCAGVCLVELYCGDLGFVSSDAFSFYICSHTTKLKSTL